jgi:hypothetical protein
MSPADLPWWGWMLYAIGAFVVSFFSLLYASNKSNRPGKSDGALPIFLAVVFGLVTFGTGLIGIIRFVKWVWGS